jgi:hypothetical protein
MIRADGTIKQLSVDSAIQTSPQNVNGVYYNVHVPTNVIGWIVAYTGDLDVSREHVTVSADMPNDYYMSFISASSTVRTSLTGTARMEGRSISKTATVDRPIRLVLIKH